jgi:hypothetical protein
MENTLYSIFAPNNKNIEYTRLIKSIKYKGSTKIEEIKSIIEKNLQKGKGESNRPSPLKLIKKVIPKVCTTPVNYYNNMSRTKYSHNNNHLFPKFLNKDLAKTSFIFKGMIKRSITPTLKVHLTRTKKKSKKQHFFIKSKNPGYIEIGESYPKNSNLSSISSSSSSPDKFNGENRYNHGILRPQF